MSRKLFLALSVHERPAFRSGALFQSGELLPARRNMEILRDIARQYNVIFHERDDPRTKTWFLMSGPTVPLAIIALYLHFVLYLGPRFMASRKPYRLSKIIVSINVMQVVVNVWIINEFLHADFYKNFNYICNTVDYSDNPTALRVVRACWVYANMKVLDLADTVLMVLRKKYSQVSFLHIFHHVTTLGVAWSVVKFAPGGFAVLPQTLNSMVHVLMYTYYLLASLGPEMQPYLWWKKYLTTIQIVQLTAMTLYTANAILRGCNYPTLLLLPSVPMLVVDLIMFFKFYRLAYCRRLKLH